DRRQTHRRVMVPGLRGVIYDREHRMLAGNRERVAAVLNLEDLRSECAAEERSIIQNSLDPRNTDGPAAARRDTMIQARFTVVERHHERINSILRRNGRLDPAVLERHIARERTVPFVL